VRTGGGWKESKTKNPEETCFRIRRGEGDEKRGAASSHRGSPRLERKNKRQMVHENTRPTIQFVTPIQAVTSEGRSLYKMRRNPTGTKKRVCPVKKKSADQVTSEKDRSIKGQSHTIGKR